MTYVCKGGGGDMSKREDASDLHVMQGRGDMQERVGDVSPTCVSCKGGRPPAVGGVKMTTHPHCVYIWG